MTGEGADIRICASFRHFKLNAIAFAAVDGFGMTNKGGGWLVGRGICGRFINRFLLVAGLNQHPIVQQTLDTLVVERDFECTSCSGQRFLGKLQRTPVRRIDRDVVATTATATTTNGDIWHTFEFADIFTILGFATCGENSQQKYAHQQQCPAPD